MEFPYVPRFFIDPKTKKQSTFFRPEIPIRMSYGHHLFKSDFLALLDSGSDCNLFPFYYGLVIGINIRKGQKRLITGIGRNTIETFRHPIRLFLGQIKIDTYVDFNEHQLIPLLGRRDFFKFFTKISFFEQDNRIVLK